MTGGVAGNSKFGSSRFGGLNCEGARVEKLRGLRNLLPVALPASPNVIPKEARLRDLPGISLPFRQKGIRSIIAGDSSSCVVGMTREWQSSE